MQLSPGTRLGPYEIVAPIGAGGMGEVYKARDTRLEREAAIKILPAAFAADAERVARFQREARTLAALNHPNIAQIFGLEHVDGGYALAMELVPGEDLSLRIARGAVPLDETIEIATQVAEALEAAHEQGIIHRDLKPANIQVRPDGVVKVLDFGLAKALEPSGGSFDSAAAMTVTSPAMTAQGVILGTAAYMSPEQARGKALDRRADVWAFGCVLFEMLSGCRAFPGDTVSDTLAAVLRGEPAWDALPGGTPPALRRLLRRCLAKDRRQRLGDMSGVRLDLGESLDSPAAAGSSLPPRNSATAQPSAGWLAASLAAGSLLTAAAAYTVWPEPAAVSAAHFTVEMPSGHTWQGSNGSGVVMSHDGRTLAFLARDAADRAVFLRSIDSIGARRVSGSSGGYSPFFSPDDRELGFFAEGRLWRLPVDSDKAIAIAQVNPVLDRGAAWSPDGYIYLGGQEGISRIPASGGPREPLTSVDRASGEFAHRFPQLLPGGRGLLFSSMRKTLDESRIGVLDLDRKETRLLDVPGHAPQYAAPGQIVFMRTGTLMSAPFDLAQLNITGPAQPILADVAFNEGGAGHFDVSPAGVLVYTPGRRSPITTPVWSDRRGQLSATSIPAAAYTTPRLSPDGRRLALVRRDSNNSEIVIWDFAGQSLTSLTGNALVDDSNPLWISNTDLVISRARGAGGVAYLHRARADGNGQPTRLLPNDIEKTGGGADQRAASVTSDGTQLFYSQIATREDGIHVMNLATSETRRVLESGSAPKVSPDSRWLVHTQRWVQPYPDLSSGRWPLPGAGLRSPTWSSRSSELFYLSETSIMTISPNARSGFVDARASRLFDLPENFETDFDVAADGQRFLLLRVDERPQDLPHVIVNWLRK